VRRDDGVRAMSATVGLNEPEAFSSFSLGVWIPPRPAGQEGESSGDATAEAALPGVTDMRGRVTKLIYKATDSDFCIVEVEPTGEDERAIVKGAWMEPRIGAILDMHGVWKPRKGHLGEMEFAASAITEVVPKDSEGLYLWLRSGVIKGIGEVWARRLVDHFGMDLIRVMDEDPDRLAEVEVPPRVMEVMKAGWVAAAPQRVLMPFLRECGLGTEMSGTVWRHFKEEVKGNAAALVETIRANPYLLAEVSGIGFKIADQAAGRLGTTANSPARVMAGIEHVLHQQGQEGHVWIERERLSANARRLLGGVSSAVIDECLAAAEEKGEAATLRKQTVRGRECWANATASQVEKDLAERIKAISGPAAPLEVIHPVGFTLDPSQITALEAIIATRLGVLTGGPGMGKTTLISQLLAGAAKANLSVQLCAPTGRAAKRMSEATGYSAATIHRMMIYKDEAGEPKWHDRNNPLPAQLIIVDEASMKDQYLAAKFFDAIGPDTRVVLVGDSNQLPSVGQGRVLEDIIESGIVPVGRLSKIHRQGAGSSIPVVARSILEGGIPKFNGAADMPVLNLAKLKERIEAKLDKDGLIGKSRRDAFDAKLTSLAVHYVAQESAKLEERMQVLAPMRKGPLGTMTLNAALREHFNPDEGQPQLKDGRFRVGDQVIHLQNNYQLGVFNGEMGLVTGITQSKEGDPVLHVEFDDEGGARTVDYVGSKNYQQLDLSYCLTFHKSQGGQFRGVALFADTSHYNMLTRNLVYTGLTRAEEHMLFATSTKALQMTIDKEKATPRRTALSELLSGVKQEAVAAVQADEFEAPEDWEINLGGGGMDDTEPQDEAPKAWNLFAKPAVAPAPVAAPAQTADEEQDEEFTIGMGPG
jgi:exodeoxyribonuclease V alpha subunit